MTVDVATYPRPAGFSLVQYAICLKGIVWREGLRFLHQRERFVAALVRPLVWLFIFAAGFRQVLGVSIIPPYETYVLYEVYITPGLMLLIQLFNGMQSSLSMVYDREMGNMRTLLVSSPRWYLLVELAAGMAVSLPQVYTFRRRLALGYRGASRLYRGAAGPKGPASCWARRHADVVGQQAAREFRRRHELRDLPDVLRLVRALSAVARKEGSLLLYYICELNPFTHAVELVRAYLEVN
jgi:ABC-2 type transport system permease protein